jgi:rare lipoprotein A (peptidoglycan hydrolase)
MRKLVISCAVAALVVLSSRSIAEPPSIAASVQAESRRLPTERGLASWYGEERQGNLTANGELFDMKVLTAAHRTLPMGARVRVTNLRNRKLVTLRINDRGPGIAGRLIDVSMAAASSLGFLNSGLVPVQLEVVSLPKPKALNSLLDTTPAPDLLPHRQTSETAN